MRMSVLIAALRWLARLSGLMIAGGFVAIVVGETLSSQSGPPSKLIEWTGIVLLTAACAGMLIAWRWELPGAALSLASLVAYTVLIQMSRHTVIFVMAVPGILFVVDWLLRRLRTLTPAAGN
jgi:hypothetical protein